MARSGVVRHKACGQRCQAEIGEVRGTSFLVSRRGAGGRLGW